MPSGTEPQAGSGAKETSTSSSWSVPQHPQGIRNASKYLGLLQPGEVPTHLQALCGVVTRAMAVWQAVFCPTHQQ